MFTMIIKSALINRFRGFQNETIPLGEQLTVVAGLNGTQKTTLLGILSQPFTITDDTNPMYSERPLSGGTYKSAFSEKFRLSEKHDKPKEHEWTLNLTNDEPFVVESIPRGGEDKGIRFWKKGNREAGSGYIQLPVIYLSLKRLIPIGEEKKLKIDSNTTLTPQEITWLTTHYNDILISLDEITTTDFLASTNKNTIGVSTDNYDWNSNSSGQDNVGKILLSILSFKRLKEKYPGDYKGGLLVIDELDAALYPASQIKLLHALRQFSSRFSIQTIFTTHSLSLLESACRLREETMAKSATSGHVRVLFLEKIDGVIKVNPDTDYSTIVNRLNVTLGNTRKDKIYAFPEDAETAIFAKALLKGKAKYLDFVNATLGAENIIEMARRKIPSFSFPNTMAILDGDMANKKAVMDRVRKFRNILVLPGKNAPEKLLAEYLHQLSENSPVWKTIHKDFTKQYCFKDISYAKIMKEREDAKRWFNLHKAHWGKNCTRVINPWIKENQEIADVFVKEFVEMYNKFATKLGIDEIED